MNEGAGGRVRDVVAPSRRVVNRLLAAARDPPLERRELRLQCGQLEQLDARAVYTGQQVRVDLRLRELGWRVRNAMRAESFRDPPRRIAITCDAGQTVTAQRAREVLDDLVGGEG